MKQDRFHAGLGVFVIGAMMIVIATSVTLYNQYLHGKIETYVMFFKGSLNGLETGSSVLYRGVKIGKVNRIELTANKAKTNVAIPVYVEFFVEKSFAQRNNPIQVLIANGMVAQITSPQLLTGRSTIRLAPAEKNIPIIMKKTPYHHYSRFPTQNVNENIVNFDDALKTAETTMKAAQKTLKDISTFFQSPKLNQLIKSVTGMASHVEGFAADFNRQLPSVVAQFNNSLKSISNAADSTKNFTDYLARHPEALLRGKS